MNKKNALNPHRMAFIAIFAALNCICAWLAVPNPFSGTSFSLQTFAIILTGLVLSPLESLTTSVVYILLGAVGLPVFSSFGTLYSRLFTPYGGYIIGFLFAPLLISLTKNALVTTIERKHLSDAATKTLKSVVYIGTAIVLGLLVIDIPAVIQHKLMSGTPWSVSIAMAALTFFPTDLLKCILAAVVSLALEKPLNSIRTKGKS
ncbi:MAG: biotin transporter BioY [Ruminococcus sp.]|nr:biotin transporter BioY [Ruminococcus sp.]